ncbi:VC0807 family protein [Corallincola platygyrae]|uniref:VC0807 family protein n=1 Tax=Corallincola platygyrae TaxID=1193278 RepID=A0ABW4XS97_9GAMM
MTEQSIPEQRPPAEHKPRTFIDLLVSIVIPSVILMKLSDETALGPVFALVLALSFPLSWGLFEKIRYRKFNWVALLGIISVMLTGGIGLLELDPKWLAIKEAAVPGLIGLVVAGSVFTPYPLVRKLLFNPALLNVELVEKVLNEKNNVSDFDRRLKLSNFLLAGTFFFSSVMNYVLAKWIVTSPAGTAAFNEELGRMTLLSYPVIVIPSMVMLAAILYYLWHTIHQLTELSMEEVFTGMAE